MGLYEGIKDAAKMIQQADNIELYKNLLDLSAQALDMQAELNRLSEENTNLKKELEQKEDIEYHKTEKIDGTIQEYPYVTLKSDKEKIRYCGVCYGKKQVLIPLYDNYNCIVCRQEMKR